MAQPEFQNARMLKALPALLLPWFQSARRELPWRRDREPYHVWLSEIMLQQTRVEAVKGYYTRFLDRLPDIRALAGIDEDTLLKLWEGLGYYNRVRNLQKAARLICTKYAGSFPSDLEAIRALPGIGDYTAGAIASICYSLPTPAVDGNVLRVVTRYTGYYGCTDDAAVKKLIANTLKEIYPTDGNAGDFTQALMELGAIVCVPNGQPHCDSCPLAGCCVARQQHLTDELPVRAEKKKRRQDSITVFLLSCGDQIALDRRPSTGLLAGLYQFPSTEGHLSDEAAVKQAEDWGLSPCNVIKAVSRTHIFTHVQWNMLAYRLECRSMSADFIWADRETLQRQYALPTAFRQFLQDF